MQETATRLALLEKEQQILLSRVMEAEAEADRQRYAQHPWTFDKISAARGGTCYPRPCC